MLVKTFQAVSMAEALQMVKAELGPDAMIISSKKERTKGILGFFSKPVFAVTAMIDRSPRLSRHPYQESREPEGNTGDMFKKSMLEPLVREIRELKGRVESLTTREGNGDDNGKKRTEKVPGPEIEKGASVDFLPTSMTRPEIRKIADHILNAAAAKYREKSVSADQPLVTGFSVDALATERAVSNELSPQLREVLHELSDAGIENEICGTLMESLKKAADGEEGKADLRNKVKETVAGMIKCAGQLKLKRKGPKIVALVGPTGVGKTTTIAKLAAMQTLKKKTKVALVTTDNFKAGAVEQLRTYAKVLRLPLEVAATAKELERAVSKHSDKDLILIDTTGKSPREREKLDELKSLLAGFEIESHLCVSATTRDCELKDILEQFRTLPIHRLLFTKLDESRQLGCMVNLHVRNKLPLSYFTKGQRVPEDIEIATGRKVAELVLGG
jgi:flagellar biosynthesis protein FlhF